METISDKIVKDLLERYFNAETSLEEEQKLRDYFSKGDVAPEYNMYAPLFICFEEERERINVAHERKPRKAGFRWISLVGAAALAIFTFILFPQKGDSLKLVIDGVNVKNNELALSKADTHLGQLNSMLGRFRDGSTKQIESMNKMGDALSPLKMLDKIVTQNTTGDRLE